jgi:hypothetical protein
MDEDAAVADGVLVGLSLRGKSRGTSIIGLAVQYPDGKYLTRSERLGRCTITSLNIYSTTTGGNFALRLTFPM